ncbi:MAG: polysaccharide pyruvyl transferase family protein [Deltaproteobacteria bacterium]|nr:polysaccharide pyruvyl transferase family protein [Deltaproteobacteria bacterium]
MFDMDTITALGVVGASSVARLPSYERYRPGEKLKILLVGYNGKRNTGADVRVAAMVEQFYRALGRDRIQIGILTLDVENIRVYFQPPTELIEFSSIFFKDLLEACNRYHMAVLCEGSTLKSKFANALTLFFCEAAGVMKQQGKPCIAYGSEAGDMDALVKKLAAWLCRDTYFIARTEPSLEIISQMGLRGHLGTDTAWPFPPGDPAWARQEIQSKTGWDGSKPLVGIAVINPFYWPVKPSLVRLAKAAATRNWDHHYEKWYFFSASEERERLYRSYIGGIADAVELFRRERDVHVIPIGMEALDLEPCTDLCKALGLPEHVFSSRFYDGYQLCSVLHSLGMLVTSRYHARVLSMTGSVPSVAVSMDERLYNIFQECGHLDDYYLSTDEPDLGRKLHAALEKLWTDRERVAGEIRASVPRYLKLMADMGEFFREFVQDAFPGIELAPPPADWKGYLPELHPGLQRILDAHPL